MFDFFGTLIPFLLIHFICDFYLQPNTWIIAKKEHRYYAPELYVHSLLHGIASVIPAIMLGIAWQLTLCLVAIVTVTHFLIDLWKVTTPNGDKFSYLLIEQSFHISVLAMVSFHMVNDISIEQVVGHNKFSNDITIALS